MNVENITAELRPRNNWEASDLGAALARRDFGAVLLRQAVLLFPIWAAICVLLFNHPGWALLIFWWLKPIYERVPLFCLSRSLFGSRPTVGETIKAAPNLLFSDLFMALVVTRLSISRSVFQPVNQLEGLRWGGYAKRVKVLQQYASGGGLTTVVALLEIGVIFGLVALLTLLLPFTSAIDWKSVALALIQFQAGTIPTGTFWMLVAVYLLAVFLLTPFYSGAGFGTYINARTQLEGWDIEIALRRLGERLAPPEGEAPGGDGGSTATRTTGKAAAAALLVGLLGFGGAFAGAASAAPEPDEAITEVLADPDFEIHKTKLRIPRPELGDLEALGKPKFPSSPSAIGEILFYLLISAAAGGLIWLIVANRHVFFGGSRDLQPVSKARTVMGLDVAADSLPDDIPAAAREAWEQGDIHRAVSLLYRGAICWMVERGDVHIRESDTEHDCLSRARQSLRDRGRNAFFAEVTDHWVMQAYGSIPPQDETFHSVCSRWLFHLSQSPDLPAENVSTLQPATSV